MAKTAQLIIDGKTYELPIIEGTEDEVGIEIGELLEKTGLIVKKEDEGSNEEAASE